MHTSDAPDPFNESLLRENVHIRPIIIPNILNICFEQIFLAND